MSCSQRLQHSQLITFKRTYWSSTCVCLTPSPDRSIKVSILHVRPNNLASFTPTPLVPVILRGYYSLFHFNINASALSLVRRERRTQLGRSFGSRSPSVWVQFGVTSCHFSGLLLPSPVRGVSQNHLILLSEACLFVLLFSVFSQTFARATPAPPNAIYFYPGAAAVSLRMLLIGPLVTTGKVTSLSNSFWAAAFRNPSASRSH